jgi:hypothetical protein
MTTQDIWFEKAEQLVDIIHDEDFFDEEERQELVGIVESVLAEVAKTAQQKEREECAKECEAEGQQCIAEGYNSTRLGGGCFDCAGRIRTRK